MHCQFEQDGYCTLMEAFAMGRQSLTEASSGDMDVIVGVLTKLHTTLEKAGEPPIAARVSEKIEDGLHYSCGVASLVADLCNRQS